MSSIENKIKSLNIKLPEPKAPVGAYVATKIIGEISTTTGKKRYLIWFIFSIEIL